MQTSFLSIPRNTKYYEHNPTFNYVETNTSLYRTEHALIRNITYDYTKSFNMPLHRIKHVIIQIILTWHYTESNMPLYRI